MTLSHFKKFSQDGYLIVDNAISREELLAFQHVFHQVIKESLKRFDVTVDSDEKDDIATQCDQGLIALNNANPDYPLFVQACVSRSPEYYHLCSNKEVISYIKYLLGLTQTSPVYLTNNGIIFTHPNNDANKRSSNIEIEWHRDNFFTIPKSRFLHVWIPLLHDATKANGALQVCPGSHKEGLGKQLIDAEAPYDHRYLVDPATVACYQPISLEIRLGQALIFDNCLMHRSGKNTSDQVRCTLIGLHHDVSNPNFYPLSVSYGYIKQTPEAYFYEVYGDQKAIPLLDEQALNIKK